MTKVIKKLTLICFVFILVFLSWPMKGRTQYTAGDLGVDGNMDWTGSIYDTNSIKVKDSEAINKLKGIQTGQTTEWQKEAARQATKKSWTETLGSAFKSALKYFLNKLAYDTATYLASGDKGQKPMFVTQSWADYLTDVADNAAGKFLETLGKEGPIKFNLCQPGAGVLLKISLGLKQYKEPDKPACTFSQLRDNWENSLKDKGFLTKFQDMFNPWSNDFGIALSLQSGISQEIDKAVNTAIKERETNQGYKDVTSAISGVVKTPSNLVRKAGEEAFGKGTYAETTFTGTLADAIDVFLNTLIGKLIERWLQEGLYDEDEDYTVDLTSEESVPQTKGIAGAKERFRTLVEPTFGTGGDYSILAELSTCPDPQKAGPTDCVITEKFRQAIENKLTVGQAITQGSLDGVFAFKSDGLEPSYNEGYPYRSLIILRKFRIIPVGWEVAAEFIKNHPQAESLGGSGGTRTIKDLASCFSEYDEFTDYNYPWCRGLVDPSWVLKAPLNFCSREGAGPEIISDQITGEGDTSRREISRNSEYCADEQACIKENDKGSCDLYGYCIEERRKWNFETAICNQPRNNTCQSFRDRSGQTVSYLENTLDYDSCTVDSIGCKKYATTGTYNSSDKSITWDGSINPIYFDKDAQSCDSSEEGCHEFIRLKAGLGANLLINSSFENSDPNYSWWLGVGTIANESYEGSKSLQLTANLNKTINFTTSGYQIAGQSFTLSFYVKNCGASDNFKIDGQSNATNLTQSTNWQRYQTSYIFPANTNVNVVSFSINSSSCLIDAVKLEFGNQATVYSDYQKTGVIYEKLLPIYFDNICYTASGQPITGAPAECNNFVRKCTNDEVGCELYTSVINNIKIPAKVKAQDYCPAECLGYDTYIQSQTNFDSLRNAYLIPATAKTCDIASAGCDQFTNLDEVARGGEGLEYYTNLRQCIKPNQTDCSEYYSWEGSDETGYQLKVFNLKKDASNNPAITEDDSAECNETIYNLGAVSPSYNPDCRQFYNRSGYISYHLYQRTISCDDNCHPYRRTEKNIDPQITTLAGCGNISCTDPQANGEEKCWDNTSGACIYCKNGGVYDTQHKACIYSAIPGQGIVCSAEQNGCREYSGNSGNNLRILFTHDFEDGTGQGWSGGTNSTESVIVGKHSYKVANTATLPVGAIVTQGNSYVISFLAKAQTSASTLTATISNSTNQSPFAGSASLISTQWRYFKLNLANLNHQVDIAENLIISSTGGFYIDDIRLTEITDRYYLIKNSWVTPTSCDQDIDGNPSPLYMLGCEAYHDREGGIHNLHSFSYLCAESAVGCEFMIDTYNSTSPFSQTVKSITTAADSYSFVVYDDNKQCNLVDKGCQRLGSPYYYETQIIYNDTYLKNDPDKYQESLCDSIAENCEEWISSEGSSYFKDPGDLVCEWRQQLATTTNPGWYKKKIKRCDDGSGGGTINGKIDIDNNNAPRENNVCLKDVNCGLVADKTNITCTKDSDCDNDPAKDLNKCISGKCHYSCIRDTNDYACPTDMFKTFGIGGQGNIVYQPTRDIPGNYWVGLCPANEAGCSEYIDPVSRFSNNMIFNADFSQDVDNDNQADGWTSNQQTINLEPNTLYILAVEGQNQATLTGNLGSNFYLLNNLNILGSASLSFSVNGVANSRVSKVFYNKSSTEGNLAVTSSLKNNGSKIELKKAIVDYLIRSKIDKQSCNGLVDFEQGCILFNERIQNGASLAQSIWDADLTVLNDENGVAPQAGQVIERDSNLVLQVRPDRVCNKWLASRSYYKENNEAKPVSFDIGLCDSLDDNDDCDNFIISKPENQAYRGTNFTPPPATYTTQFDAGKISNFTGYNKVGEWAGSLKNDYYSMGEMKQTDGVANLPNGNFEFAGTNGYPIGWKYEGDSGMITTEVPPAYIGAATTTVVSWDDNIFKVIDDPIEAQSEGIAYAAPEGRNFLRIGSAYNATSEFIDVEPNTDYIITGYINTKNLKNGKAIIWVQGSDNSVLTTSPIIELNESNDWTFKLGKFTTGNNISRIKTILFSYDTTYISCSLAISDYDICVGDNYTWTGRTNPIQGYKVLWYGTKNGVVDENGSDYGVTTNFTMDDYGRIGVVGEYTRYFTAVDANNNVVCTSNTINMRIVDCTTTPAPFAPNNQANTDMTGNTYFDDIKIKPALISRDKNETEKWYTPQTCRLYSQEDSLSCDYYDDSGKRERGWLGYCLEYDRDPGSKDTCLLWYPVDKVRGEGIEEGRGYNDRFPLYYCVDSGSTVRELTVNKSGAVVNCGTSGNMTCCNRSSYAVVCEDELPVNDINCQYKAEEFVPEGEPYLKEFLNINNIESITYKSRRTISDDSDWCWDIAGDNAFTTFKARFNPDGSLKDICHYGCDYTSNNYPGYYKGDVTIKLRVSYCKDLTQVVTPTGQNKYWSGRVYQGSAYQSICQDYMTGNEEVCSYNSDYKPFGSIVYPAPASNPFEWDSKTGDGSEGNQPLFFELPDTNLAAPYQARAGQSYSERGVKRLFAKNYDSWSWGTGICDQGEYKDQDCIVDEDCIGSCAKYCINNGVNPIKFGKNCIRNSDCDYDNDGECIIEPGVTEKACVGGCNDGQLCDNDSDCQGSCFSCSSNICGHLIDGATKTCRASSECSGTCAGVRSYYFEVDSPFWDPPTDPCPPTGRPSYQASSEADYCAVLPQVINIKVDKSEFSKGGFVNLTFNSVLDSQQLPLVMYSIDWGDGEKTVVSGVEMRDRPNAENPHSFYHLYSYWDLKGKAGTSQCPGGSCDLISHSCNGGLNNGKSCIVCTSDYCSIKPKVQVKDNWGWCNRGTTINVCGAGQWDSFNGQIVVKEK